MNWNVEVHQMCSQNQFFECINVMLNCIKYFRIAQRKSLFDGYFSKSTASSLASTYCSAVGSFCETDSGFDDDYISTSGWTIMICRVPLSWSLTEASTSRKRREISPPPEDYDVTYNSGDFEFTDPSISTEEWNITWPTPSGITYSQAVGNCIKVLWDEAPYKSSCSKSLSQDDINAVIDKCVLDVQVYVIEFCWFILFSFFK